jgi:hypothetical protein
MQFMIMHKNDPRTEAGQPPPLELVGQMGAFIGEYASTGRFIDGAGLAGSSTRTRLLFCDGRCSLQQGPYAGERELPTTLWQLKVGTREQAIEWAQRYGQILGDGEIELGKVNEPWDIGLMPVPDNPPLQFLLIDKADAASEAGGRSPQLLAELARLQAEATAAGVLVKTLTLKPSKTAKRLRFRDNELIVIDGPFTETKELIGGFAVIELSDMDEAIAMCRRYAAILGGTLEIDIRRVETGASV